MVVYIPNANVLAIELLCRRELADGTVGSPEHAAALKAFVDEIERHKQRAPYILHQRLDAATAKQPAESPNHRRRPKKPPQRRAKRGTKP